MWYLVRDTLSASQSFAPGNNAEEARACNRTIGGIGSASGAGGIKFLYSDINRKHTFSSESENDAKNEAQSSAPRIPAVWPSRTERVREPKILLLV